MFWCSRCDTEVENPETISPVCSGQAPYFVTGQHEWVELEG